VHDTAPISIIIRSMDRSTLIRALDSVSAQELKPLEVVVVAACGRGHGALPSVHEAIRARLVFPENGASPLDRPRAANLGLDSAVGDWIGFLDDDDEYLPHHLNTLWTSASQRYQQSGRGGRLAYSLAQGVDASGRDTDRYGRSFSLVQIWESTILHTMNGLFHRSLLDDGCRFDESLDVLEDWDFWIQCAQHTGFTFVETATTIWHGDEGESGCGFGKNYDQPRFVSAQTRVQEKWRIARETALAALQGTRLAAHAARARGDEAEAIRLSQWVLRRDPENADMANLLGMMALKRGDTESAAQLIDSAIRNTGPNPGLMLNRGLVELTRGNQIAAREWFDKGRAISPDHPALTEQIRRLEGI
jgi:tetratricopeptide (TPR) repeat protein